MENITTQLLTALRTHLETHPIEFRGDADSMIDFLFDNYIEYVPISTMRETESYGRLAGEIFRIMKERDEARGVESHIVRNRDGYPYNEELEKVLNLVGELETAYGNEAFRTGFGAGARIAFEVMGEKSVGITTTTPDGVDKKKNSVTGKESARDE